jgi:DNA-binding CsgD family transcriptional regulator
MGATPGAARDVAAMEMDGAAVTRLCRLGICLAVDKAGRVVGANGAGRDFVRAGAILRLEAGLIAANTATATTTLRDAIRRAASGTAGAVPLTVPRRDGGLHPVLVSHPGEAVGCAGLEAQAMVQSLAPDYRGTGPTSALLAVWFGLTPAEAAVALRAARGVGLRAIADALGVQHSTARSHLRRVFQKAGVSRQAELAWLVAHLPR